MRRFSRGFTIFELIIAMTIIGIFAGIFMFVIKPRVDEWRISSRIKSEFLQITQGLSNYFGNNYRYPNGNGWGWTQNGEYVPPEVFNKGWQYSCSGSTITIRTPVIQNPRIRTKIRQQLARVCNNVSVSGGRVVCTLTDRPCI